jgi:ribosomal protein S18 acetylase RimI-like enzyme
MTGPIETRAARPGDLHAIAALHMAAYRGQPSLLLQLGPRAVGSTYRWFIGNPQGFALMATVDGRPGGFLMGMHGTAPEATFRRHRMRVLLLSLLLRPGILRAAVKSRIGDRTTGHAPLDPATTSFYSLAVAPEFHGLKLGNLLMAAGEAAAREAGMRQVVANVGRQNLASLFLYRSLKYQVVGSLPGSGQFRLAKPLA